MSIRDELGTRMKEFYEQVPKTRLVRRTPVAIRIDGKAFHTFTRGFQKPFDEVLVKSMQRTMQYLCENIQGCVLGYTQSDEITLILVDYKKLTSSAWFDYEVQKVCSVSASMATMAFNKFFAEEVAKYEATYITGCIPSSLSIETQTTRINYYQTLKNAAEKGAMFDARCFNIPKEEVTNLIYWRQQDAIRNSIQMVGQANFSHKELNKKNQAMIQDMLLIEKSINWDDFATHLKRGSCCIKSETTTTCAATNAEGETVFWAEERPHWYIDTDIPIFKDDGRDYVDKLIRVNGNCPCQPIAYIN